MSGLDLSTLFGMQKVLDERILDKHPELTNQNNLDWKILALQVELGECANEWRGFKKWSEDREPRTKIEHICPSCNGTGDESWKLLEVEEQHKFEPCIECDATGKLGESNPLLEEYVDGLHFILSIGLEVGYTFSPTTRWQARTTTAQFNDLFHAIATLHESLETDWEETEKQENFDNLLSGFIGLGEMLGFTWDQIEQAYISKNEINHARQENGY